MGFRSTQTGLQFQSSVFLSFFCFPSLWKTFPSGCSLHFRGTPLTPFSISLSWIWETQMVATLNHSLNIICSWSLCAQHHWFDLLSTGTQQKRSQKFKCLKVFQVFPAGFWRLAFLRMFAFTAGSFRSTEESFGFILSLTTCFTGAGTEKKTWLEFCDPNL